MSLRNEVLAEIVERLKSNRFVIWEFPEHNAS